jgi:asparagine synthase (glutamine-hydrolysing)
MCGIAGFVAAGARETSQQTLRTMVTALARRGPDSEGIECWPDALLGHRRLAILDLSAAGHQPMLSEDGEIGLVFNGCIYNFHDLRKELEDCGHRFRSQCDTEVLLRGYREWGIDALVRRLRGMFAFAVWDNPQRKLTLVRDPLGVKPLLYSVRNGQIAFASTVTAIHAAGLAGEIDSQAVLEFLEFGFVTDDRTIYGGVEKLPAGTLLEWQNNRITKRSYWALPEPDERSRITFTEAVEETARLLVEAVRLRLCADVPIGALLSGGIDSTLVCWAMAKLNANIKAFTVSTPGDSADEAPAAIQTARTLDIPHEVVALPHEQETLLDELTDAYGEPFGCSSALAMLRVSRSVKPLATVLLTGDGGDDVFLGYPFHRHFWMAQRFARSLPAQALPAWQKARGLINGFGPLSRPKHFLDYATGGLGAVTRVHDGLPYYTQRIMLGEKLRSLELPQRRIPLSIRSGRRVLAEVLQYDQRTRFVGEFMTKVDGGAMHYAIEARSPFLDQKLWEFAARLPLSIRLHGTELKPILREIVQKNVGDQVASRKKQGFTVPVEQWLATRWSKALRELGRQSVLETGGWISPGTIRSAVEEGIMNRWAPTQLWYLLTLEHWLQRQVAD